MLPYESSRKVPKEMIIKMNLKFNREILLSSLIKRAINSPIIFLKKLFEFIFNINLSRPSSIKHPSFMLFMTKSLIYDTYFEEKI